MKSIAKISLFIAITALVVGMWVQSFIEGRSFGEWVAIGGITAIYLFAFFKFDVYIEKNDDDDHLTGAGGVA